MHYVCTFVMEESHLYIATRFFLFVNFVKMKTLIPHIHRRCRMSIGPASPEIREVVAASEGKGPTSPQLVCFDGAVLAETRSGHRMLFASLPLIGTAPVVI
jgi:hypothetical protein